ncbi:hypothetical protein KFZ70_04575 [Tamlana fucoidanivorans]|uniref:Uncharacterized protein n=1 Tax=Allotamlana fucoidanivorans TaxID=2583814 RepID=A0A5C4SS60_9FLAO|nr:hypothetical protein FGF67_01400 [Tamlana fucoidanivorans]
MLFLLFVTAPTVILMVDDSIDVSSFYTCSEEEEKGGEKHKEIDPLVLDQTNSELPIPFGLEEFELFYFFKKYQKPHLNLISPPPDYNLV